MPTINDIAKALGISKGTVSKALNHSDDISETLRKKVLETAVEMGYEKNVYEKEVCRNSVFSLNIWNTTARRALAMTLSWALKSLPSQPAGK